MRCTAILRIVVILLTLLTTWFFAEKFFSGKKDIKRNVLEQKKVKINCGNEKPCPDDYFAFKIISGAANVVGPSICFENIIIMSSVRNNIGRGLNIALINASTGILIKTDSFDMYSGDVKPLLDFIKPVKDGTLVFVASFDDPGTKLNDEARAVFTEFGSSYAKKINFRDSWLFVGGKGINSKSPFEQHIKNNKETNKYDGWPEVLEMEGCIPRKTK
ncbi:Protein FAM3D-like [Xenopus laevis]|uniref:MGC52899 protein n=2 Tax=Xenopus laevis TaxID=8355 RepID=A0AA97PZC9_XENLA|nr:uncharacterized protein LOC379382 [Xenopus laevis]AAH47961.1 MGC52899 protein [Xenopus laevis]OCT56888.1 hypothetical protein XELAEV_18004250mg [Xenopus laevis]